MSNTMNYHPAKYHHFVEGDLYIDHQRKETFWAKLKDQIQQGVQVLNARMRIVFDSQARATYRTRMIRQQLRDVGLNRFDMLKSETYYITKLLHKDETILGAIVGHLDEGGSALMVVTDLRIIYLNQIPLFIKMDEIGYALVEGISSSVGQWDVDITLHTSIGDFNLYSVSIGAAKRFIDSVEKVSIDVGSPATYPRTNH